jgi:hypothetical protein
MYETKKETSQCNEKTVYGGFAVISKNEVGNNIDEKGACKKGCEISKHITNG